MVHEALTVAEEMAADGLEIEVVDLRSVKPLDTEALHAHAERARAIVSVEEHTVIGGLGSGIAEYLAETDLLGVRRFKRIGIPDVFPSIYGDQNGMMREYGISAENVVREAQALLTIRPGRASWVAAA